MRTIVDLPDEHVRRLDLMAKRMGVSRAELIRKSVGQVLAEERRDLSKAKDEMFGFLKDCPEAFDGLDGLAYQKKIRAEYDDREADIDRRLAQYLSDQNQKPYTIPEK